MAASSQYMIIGLAFASISIISVFLLLRKGKLSPYIRFGILGSAALMGFLFLAPLFPLQIQQIALGGSTQLPFPVWGFLMLLSLIVISAFIFGRTFCGYGCPIGALQEMAYHLPVPKLKFHNSLAAHLMRALIFASMIVLGAGFSFSVLGALGIKDLFSLNFAAIGLFVFLAVIICSVVLYRPFCRLACPFGVFQGLASRKPHYAIRRTEACVSCRKCERVCPTAQAGIGSKKDECYLCLRCVDVCPKGALEYSLEQKQR